MLHPRTLRALTLVLLAITLLLAVRGLYGPQGAWVHIRWQPSVDAAERLRLETAWQLVDGREDDSSSTWRYDLIAPSAGRLRAIVEHAAVEDTHYIDRQQYTLAPDAQRTARRGGLITVGGAVAVGLVDSLAALLAVLAGLCALVSHPMRVLRGAVAAVARWLQRNLWLAAAVSSILISLPLVLKGTPDVESYIFPVFSTLAFARNLTEGVDPWFVAEYGFGIALPTGSWFLKFPPALLAALLGPDSLYAAVWIGGALVFALYFTRLSLAVTRSRGISLVLLVTAMLSFSSLGPSYVDDHPDHFLGWAFYPAALWFVLRTLEAASTRERVQAAARCGLALCVFVGCTHLNLIVTFYSGVGLVLLCFLRSRPLGVLAAGTAMLVALGSALDVLVPTVQGMLAGGANPLQSADSALSFGSYGVFLEPLRAALTGGPAAAFQPFYERVPFFGLIALALAAFGAVLPFVSRRGGDRQAANLDMGLSVGFVVHSTLILLPPLVMLNLPSMWMYRDGQTVFGLLCAGMALRWLQARRGRWIWPVLAVHVAQIAFVAAPTILERVVDDDEPRLFAYARREHTLFDGLSAAGVNDASRLMLAGQLDDAVRQGSLPEAGVTASTDFPLEGMAVVNAWYRGSVTPELGAASSASRYGAYQTRIDWNGNLEHLTPEALDVLGITHVAAFVSDAGTIALLEHLTPVAEIDLDDGKRVAVLRNDDAWTGATLLTGGPLAPPDLRPGCPEPLIACWDYTDVRVRLQARLEPDWQGSSMTVQLPPGHAGGQLFVSTIIGPTPHATADGQPREVGRVLGGFGTVAIEAGDSRVTLSVQRRDRIVLSLVGFALMGVCLAVALIRPVGGELVRTRG